MKKPVVLSLMLLAFATLAFAVSPAYEYFRGNDNTNSNVHLNQWLGQGFNVGTHSASDFRASTVQVKGFRDGVSPILYLNITLANRTGSPTGSSLANGTLDISGLTTVSPGAWVNITLSNTVDMRLGQNYSIILSTNGSAERFKWRANTSSSYSMRSYSSTDAGVTWVDTGGATYLFEVFGSPLSSVFSTLNSPEDGLVTANSTLVFNVSGEGVQFNLTNATYYLYNTTANVNLTTNDLTGQDVVNQTFFNITDLSVGTYSWNVLVCGTNNTATLCDFDDNRTFEVLGFTVDSLSYPDVIYETDNQTMVLNLSLQESYELFSATLNYHDRSLLADSIIHLGGGSYSIKKSFDAPVVESNTTRSFYWSVTLDSGDSFTVQNTNNQSQNVSLTNITEVGASNLITYNIFDEETLTAVNANFDKSLEWYLGYGSIHDNKTFSRAKASAFGFGGYPDEVFYTDSFLTVHNATGYYSRNFEFVNDLYVQPGKTQNLYLLPQGNGTEIIVEIKDSGLIPLENYLVTIERYYPADDTFRMVEQKKTDVFGQITARLIENSVKYKFTIRNPDHEIVKQSENFIATCRSSICVIQFIVQDETDVFGNLLGIEDYSSDLTYNNNTRKVLFTWSDGSGDASQHRLEITQYLFNGTTILYNATSDDLFGGLDYTLPDLKANYKIQGFRKVGSSETRVQLLNVKVGDEARTFGKEGLLWSFFLLMTLIVIGSFHPPTGFVLYMVGFIALGVSGIVHISPALLIANLLIGVLFIWAFKS